MPSAVAAPSSAGAAPESASDSAPVAMSESRTSSAPTTPMAKTSSVATTTPVAAKGAPADQKKTDAQAADFLIMYTGDVAMSVDDGKVSQTIDKILDVTESVGGHLAGRRDLSVTIRVPSSHFREALGKVAELGEVTHQSVTAEDVSEEYHDAEVRIANLKATRQRLQDFLAKSANMNDMLTLERELERVSMDIDRVEGRMRFLREHTAYSTLTIALTARPKAQAIVATPNGKPSSAAPRVMQLRADWLEDMGVPKLVGN